MTSFIFVVHLLPLIEELKGCERCAQLVFGAVADDGKCAILQKSRNVSHIASAYLAVGIAHRCVLLRGVLQFHDANGNTIHEEQNVGTPVLSPLFHHKLVHATEDVSLRMLEVYVFQMEWRFAVVAIREVVAVAVEQESVLSSIVFVLATHVSEVGNNAIYFCICQVAIRIPCSKKRAKVVFDKWVGKFSVQFVTERIPPLHVLQKLYRRFLKLAFV